MPEGHLCIKSDLDKEVGVRMLEDYHTAEACGCMIGSRQRFDVMYLRAAATYFTCTYTKPMRHDSAEGSQLKPMNQSSCDFMLLQCYAWLSRIYKGHRSARKTKYHCFKERMTKTK